MKSKHTKGGYVLNNQGDNGIYVVTDAPYSDAILRVYTDNATVKSKEEAVANAERIIKAVNCHDELVEALAIAYNEIMIARKQIPLMNDFNLATEKGKKAWKRHRDKMIRIENIMTKATK